jgi:hypothetical protein
MNRRRFAVVAVVVVVAVVAVFLTHSSKATPTALPVIQVMGANVTTVEQTYPVSSECSQITCFGGKVTYPASDSTDFPGPRFYDVSTSGAGGSATSGGIINFYAQRFPFGVTLTTALHDLEHYLPKDFVQGTPVRVSGKTGRCEIVSGTSASLAADDAANDPTGVISAEFASPGPNSKWVYTLTGAQVALLKWTAAGGC